MLSLDASHGIILQGFLHQQVAEDLIAIFRQLVLLRQTTMILEAENQRIVWSDERGVSYSVDHILEEDISAHGFTVSNDRLLVLAFTVPTVQFDASAVGTVFFRFLRRCIQTSSSQCVYRHHVKRRSCITCNQQVELVDTSQRCSFRRSDDRSGKYYDSN